MKIKVINTTFCIFALFAISGWPQQARASILEAEEVSHLLVTPHQKDGQTKIRITGFARRSANHLGKIKCKRRKEKLILHVRMHFLLKGLPESHDMNYLVVVPKGLNKIVFGKNEKVILQSTSTANQVSKIDQEHLRTAKEEILKKAPDNNWDDYWFFIDPSDAPEKTLIRLLNLKTNEVHETEYIRLNLPVHEMRYEVYDPD